LYGISSRRSRASRADRSLTAQRGVNAPQVLFVLSLMGVAMAYGLWAGKKGAFPIPQIEEAREAIGTLRVGDRPPDLFSHTKDTTVIPTWERDAVQPGLTKIVNVEGDNTLSIKVVDFDGSVVQRWAIEWSAIWGDGAAHLNPKDVPHTRPGTHIHGAEILDNGDVVFNFEGLGLQRLDACGNVKWRLAERTHHSIHIDEDGNIWVPSQHWEEVPDKRLPNYNEPFRDHEILKLSPDGQVLMRKSVIDILIDAGLTGVLYGTTIENVAPLNGGDTLHLNDIETFPRNMPEGIFKAGDVMLSIRNANGIFVFDPSDWSLRYKVTDEFVRQHDPDFISGDEISVFDNNNDRKPWQGGYSRIVIKNARTGDLRVAFQGTKEQPFFTPVMGKHQWLANGDLLVAETTRGHVLEVAPDGRVVWQFNNLSGDGYAGLVEGTQRLAPRFDRAFFEDARRKCGEQPSS